MARIFSSSVNMCHLLRCPGNRPHPHNGQASWRWQTDPNWYWTYHPISFLVCCQIVTLSNYDVQHNRLSTTLSLSPWWFSPAVIIFRLMISRHIAMPLNYRIPVSYGSDFIWINDFPEVCHTEEIIISLFSAPARRITVQGYYTTYSATGSCMRYYMLCWRDVTLCGGRGRTVTNSNGTCIFLKGKVFNLPWRGQVKNVSIERFLIHFLIREQQWLW